MTDALPPWESRNKADQQAFLDWAVAHLKDEAQERDFADYQDRSSSDFNVRLMREAVHEARWQEYLSQNPYATASDREDFMRHKFGQVPKRPPEKAGSKADDPSVLAAFKDSRRLTALFKRCFPDKDVRRTKTPPSRLEILRVAHGLTDEQVAALETRIRTGK